MMQRTITVTTDAGSIYTVEREARPSPHPQLLITEADGSAIERGGGSAAYGRHWTITHLPTGRVIPGALYLTIAAARRTVEALAAMDVDWSNDDPAHYKGVRSEVWAQLQSVVAERKLR